MTNGIRTFIHNKQPNKHAQPKQRKPRHQRGFHY